LIFGGWFGSGNLGDDAILIGVRNVLSEVIPSVEIAALSTDIDHTQRVCGVKAFPLRSPREFLIDPRRSIEGYREAFGWADACILSGGTPVYDYDHLSRIIHCGLPRLSGRKLVCFGIGVKPISSVTGKWTVRTLLGQAAALSTRERVSKGELLSLGLKKDIRVTGDSALYLEPRPPASESLTDEILASERPLVAICPRSLSVDHRAHYHAPLSTKAISQIRQILAVVGDRLSSSGYHIVFIPFHCAPGDDDMVEISLIRGMMSEPSTVLGSMRAPEEAEWLLGRMELVIGLRLHSLVLAAMRGTPIVGVDYDPKIGGFMEYAGAGDYLCRLDDSVDGIIRCSERGLDNSTTMRRRLLDSCKAMQIRIRKDAENLRVLVENE